MASSSLSSTSLLSMDKSLTWMLETTGTQFVPNPELFAVIGQHRFIPEEWDL